MDLDDLKGYCEFVTNITQEMVVTEELSPSAPNFNSFLANIFDPKVPSKYKFVVEEYLSTGTLLEALSIVVP